MVQKLFWIAAISLLGAAPAAAQPLVGFQTPSGNIHCLLAEGYLRCDLRSNIARVPRRPRDCDLEWGNAFSMTRNSRATRLCHGDTAMNPENPVLGYGRTWRQYGFVCRSATSGLTCSNRSGRGWQLSRERQRIF